MPSFRQDNNQSMYDNDICLSNQQATQNAVIRKYSKALRSYQILNNNTRTDVSVMKFDIPSNNQVFDRNTDFQFSYYYPGGEVLGATMEKDTFVIISDIFHLLANHKWDILSVAPYGNFKIYATAGKDDLDFLNINSSYPISVYHQPLKDSLWHNIGNVNDTIFENRLGTFCLGVGVSDDKEPPVIGISKESLASEVNISVTDNMAVYWKNTIVLINGVSYEYKRSGGNITVPLTAEQLAEDIYVTVYASDLARNEAQESAVFVAPAPSDIVQTATNAKIMLYPNPATDIVNLQISNEILSGGIKYAIVNTLGQVFAKDAALSENTQINVSHLPQGVYFVIVFDENKIVGQPKLIKRGRLKS